MNHTVQRHRRLYGLLTKTGTFKHRHELVQSFSDGRTAESSDLTDREADELIKHLETMIRESQIHPKADPRGQVMRRRILSLCYNIGWTTWDADHERLRVDYEALTEWLVKYSYLHKKLNDYTYIELPILVTQFERMAETFLTDKA